MTQAPASAVAASLRQVLAPVPLTPAERQAHEARQMAMAPGGFETGGAQDALRGLGARLGYALDVHAGSATGSVTAGVIGEPRSWCDL